jgi:hypothetical protein
MGNKIINVTSSNPFTPELADGMYLGTWCAYSISLSYGNIEYQLETEEGLRGISKVVVIVKDGSLTYNLIKN